MKSSWRGRGFENHVFYNGAAQESKCNQYRFSKRHYVPPPTAGEHLRNTVSMATECSLLQWKVQDKIIPWPSKLWGDFVTKWNVLSIFIEFLAYV